MMDKCPGRMPNRRLDSVVVPCPSCGSQVELFSDEPKRRCRCGHLVLRETLPKCADWCPAAERCLGSVVDVRVVRQRQARLKNDPRAKEYVEYIQQCIRRRKLRDGSQ